MNNLVSVIVPVYNVENYLRRCLDSIVNQTHKNLQIILINDGSTDNSYNICKEYSEIDNRITLIDKKNGGLSSARNEGISKAVGEYLLFVDSDDWIELDLVDLVLNRASRTKSDIVLFGYFEVDENGKRHIKGVDYGKERSIDLEDALDLLIKDKLVSSHVWDKFYKRDLFDNINFPLGKNYEDIFIMHNVFLQAKSFYFLNTPKYNYFQRDNSICHIPSSRNMLDMIDAYLKRFNDLSSVMSIEQKNILITLIKKLCIYDNQYGLINRKEYLLRYQKIIKIKKTAHLQVNFFIRCGFLLTKILPSFIRFLYKQKNEAKPLYNYCKKVFVRLKFKKRFAKKHYNAYLIGWPEYGNLGDHAIAVAEREFIENNFGAIALGIITENEVLYNEKQLKRIIKQTDLIFLQGGGNIGDEYKDQNKIRHTIFKNFKNNKIVIMPSTIYFKNPQSDYSTKIIYELSSNNVFLFCREKYSYIFMSKYKKNNLYLTPDIVLSLNRHDVTINSSKKVLFCMRSDSEKIDNTALINIMKNQFINKGYEIFDADTCVNYKVPMNDSKTNVTQLIKYFSYFEVVVTDRLHGIILSYLAGTKIIALSNYNLKIKGICEWIGIDLSSEEPQYGIKQAQYLNSFDILNKTVDKLIKENYER